MKTYLVYTNTADSELEASAKFVGTQADAAAERKRLGAVGWHRKEITTAEIDVPTDKSGMLSFLNTLLAGPSVVAALESLIK